MARNQDKIIEHYNSGKELNRSEWSRSNGLEFHYTKKHLDALIKPTDRVLEVGCASGYYGFYFSDHCKAYHGVDLVPLHIEEFKKRMEAEGKTNLSCEVGDATDLTNIKSESFDVVLCLGPMYHLPKDEREKCMSECIRVCKKGGLLAFAYINPLGVYAGACVLDSIHYPSELANENVLKLGIDDLRPDTFFYITAEEIETLAGSFSLKKVNNLGTDFFFMQNAVNELDEERYKMLVPLYDAMAETPSCTGLSNHALLMCTK